MIIVEAFDSRKCIVGFSAVISRVNCIAENDANSIEIIYGRAFSHNTSDIRLRDIFAFKANHDLFFGFERFSGFDSHAVTVEI